MKANLFPVFLISMALIPKAYSNEIGAGINSGYENMSCTQMIVENLHDQASSHLNENSLKEFQDRCKKIGSSYIGGLLTFGSKDREQCFRELWALQKRYENKMNAFANALGIRMQIYDSLNIRDRNSLSPECQHVTGASYVRPVTMSDDQYFRKLYLKCKIKTEVQMAAASKIQSLYGTNSAAYGEREVCEKYLLEYSKIRYGQSFSIEAAEQKAAAPAIAERRCVPQSCSVLLAGPTNNPSPCYRNALVECMAGGGTGNVQRTDEIRARK